MLFFFSNLTGSPRRRLVLRLLVFSVAVHAALAVIAGIWVVARYLTEPPAVFTAKKSPAIPPQIIEQQKAASEFESLSSRPVFEDRIASSRETAFALPDLPPMPMQDLLPSATAGIVSESIFSLATGAGVGAEAGGAGLGDLGSGVNFFGIQDSGRAVVIMVDVSGSMFLRLGEASFDIVKQQALGLIEGLGINTRFGIVVWSGGAGKWRKELLPASDTNKAAAKKWVLNDLNGNAYKRLNSVCQDVLREGPGGTRHDLALRQAFSFQPEIIFLLSDGNALKGQEIISSEELLKLTRDLQKSLVQEARLHTIYFVTGANKSDERELLRSLARRNNGKFEEFDAKKP
jgi:hypothetical protein